MFVLLKVQSLQLSFRPAGVSLGGGGGGGARPPSPPPPGYAPDENADRYLFTVCAVGLIKLVPHCMMTTPPCRPMNMIALEGACTSVWTLVATKTQSVAI